MTVVGLFIKKFTWASYISTFTHFCKNEPTIRDLTESQFSSLIFIDFLSFGQQKFSPSFVLNWLKPKCTKKFKSWKIPHKYLKELIPFLFEWIWINFDWTIFKMEKRSPIYDVTALGGGKDFVTTVLKYWKRDDDREGVSKIVWNCVTSFLDNLKGELRQVSHSKSPKYG